MEKREVVAEYYRCYRDRDLEALRAILAPNFRHKSSFGEYADRDAMLAEIWPTVGKSWARDLQIIGGESEFVARFVVESKERPPQRMAEYIRFEDDRIAEVETYLGRAAG
jgi:ketosteroid isomerase-like protein